MQKQTATSYQCSSHPASWLCMSNVLSHSSAVAPPKPATGTMYRKPTNEARRSYGRHAQAAGHSNAICKPITALS